MGKGQEMQILSNNIGKTWQIKASRNPGAFFRTH
jgi:hypothetical protein